VTARCVGGGGTGGGGKPVTARCVGGGGTGGGGKPVTLSGAVVGAEMVIAAGWDAVVRGAA